MLRFTCRQLYNYVQSLGACCATDWVGHSSRLPSLEERNLRLCAISDEDLYLLQLLNILYIKWPNSIILREIIDCIYNSVFKEYNWPYSSDWDLTIYRVSQEERTKLRESVPYVKLYRYNPKHLYPKLNGYGDNGQRKVWTSCISA